MRKIISKIKEIIKWFLYLFHLNQFFLKRDRYSYKFLHGHGLEIGALNRPLPVKRSVKVEYVDKITKEEALRFFKDDKIEIKVEPTIIDDGFILGKVKDASFDFVVANHVLEHSSNFFQTIENWTRVLKPNGILFMVVPIGEKCFDCGRRLTTLQHMIEDYQLVRKKDFKKFKEKNKDHWREVLTISEPNNRILKGLEPPTYSEKELNDLIRDRVNSDLDTHFHTFSVESFHEELKYFTEKIDTRFEILVYEVNKDEIISLLKYRPE